MSSMPPADPGATVDSLIAAYLRSLDETRNVPSFSLWRYWGFGLEVVGWEFAFLGLFLTPFLDALRICLKPFVATRLPSPTGWLWRYVKRPFQGIWQGDISALQVVRVRVLTRAFIGSHVAGVVEDLKLLFERARLDALMVGSQADTLAEIETERQKLESLAAVAKAQNSLGAIVATGSASALPLALAKLLIPAMLKLLPGDVAEQIGAFVPLGQLFKAIGLADDENISLTPVLLALGGGFLSFLLITAMSCHIEKRRILAEAGVYGLEDQMLRPRQIGTFELPLDVAFGASAGTAAFLTMYFYSSLALAEPDRSDQMQTAIASLVACLVVAVIVAARRWYMRRPASAPSLKLVFLRALGRA
jgi:hypothetical protein